MKHKSYFKCGSNFLTVDASEAGSGNIEILVNKGRIACSVQNLGSYKFLASFIPTKAEKHTIEMKFNNLPVVGKIVHAVSVSS